MAFCALKADGTVVCWGDPERGGNCLKAGIRDVSRKGRPRTRTPKEGLTVRGVAFFVFNVLGYDVLRVLCFLMFYAFFG